MSPKIKRTNKQRSNKSIHTCSPALANEIPSILCEKKICESFKRLSTSESVLIVNWTGVWLNVKLGSADIIDCMTDGDCSG